MPKFKTSTGYKMKGYSYPGKSPLEQNEGYTPADTTGKAAFMRDPKNLETFLEESPYETGETFKTGLTDFEKAFATARKAGKKEFKFQGKKYTTKTKE